MTEARGYAVDRTDDVETLAEAERQEDGTVRFRVVQMPGPTMHHGFTRGSFHPGPARDCPVALCRMSAPDVDGRC